MTLNDWLAKSKDGAAFARDELIEMLSLPVDAPETYALLAEGRRVSKEVTGDRAEVHAQFAVNLAPCGCGCKFCSFATINNVFTDTTELTPEECVAMTTRFEEQGANAIYMMATANYAFSKLLDIGREVRRHLEPDTVLVGNVGDRTLEEARRLKAAGFQGVYHAVRLREGVDTDLDPERRKASIRNFQEAGLAVGTCVEPVGPEHTNEELADMILFTASVEPAYSGCARRIGIPGTELDRHGMISEARMAQIVAITRMAVPRTTLGNCTHEPCTLGAAAGANLFWAEMGANPRDTEAKTEEGRGATVEQCRALYGETGCGILEGPSRYFTVPVPSEI